MQVILLEKIKNLGVLGETVKVKPGYGRNFLIPQKKAVFATATNIAMFESRRAELEQKAAKILAAAQQRAAALDNLSLSIPVQASEEGKLFGSIGVSEISKAFMAQSIAVDKHEIIMPDGPFNALGSYTITVQVHSDVSVAVQVEIVAAK